MKRYVRAAAKDLNPKPKKKLDKWDRMVQEDNREHEIIDSLIQAAKSNLGVVVKPNRIDYYSKDDMSTCLIRLPDCIVPEEFLRFVVNDVSTKDIQTITDEFIQFIETAHDEGRLIYSEEVNDYVESCRAGLDELKDITESIAHQYDSDLTLDVDAVIAKIKRSKENIVLCDIGNSLFHITHVGGAKFKRQHVGGVQLIYKGIVIEPIWRNVLYHVEPSISSRDIDDWKDDIIQWFESCTSLMDDIDVVVDQSQAFEDDIADFCDDFTADNITKYPGLSLTYEVGSPAGREGIAKSYRNNRPVASITVRCYDDQIAFQLDYTLDEWYKTDVDKKIINAIKYRKRRDGIK